ncbi:hypothetical protein H4R20_004798 [Coemansia guatemalensis]|uniref:Signal peptidase complex subunit 1 n=1 Tax=Coemansia guatemalensis TaxID=2761395 RepID=A0A9W8LSG6_9FUNG|nr:hypothetical protein H4R20_004798 [Coemansia guatemalensis]
MWHRTQKPPPGNPRSLSFLASAQLRLVFIRFTSVVHFAESMDFLKPVFESGRIDFEGQSLASSLSTLLIACAGAVALAAGFVLQRLDVCFYAYALCIAATYAVVLPPWPFFRRHPLVWLPRKARGLASGASSSSAQSRRTLVEDVSDDDSC